MLISADCSKICMFMQADPVILNTITKYLTIAGAPQGEEKSWIEKLSELDSDQIIAAKLYSSLDIKAERLAESIQLIAVKLKTYHDFYQVVFKEFSAKTPEEVDEMMKDPVKKQRYDDLVNSYYSGDDINDFESCSMMYLALASLKYENDDELDEAFIGKRNDSLIMPDTIKEGSVFDLFMYVLDNDFEFVYLYPMASVMTDSQINMIYVAGMETSILACNNDSEVWQKTEEEIKDIDFLDVKTEDVPIISVYSGVDRSIYNPEGIALSDEALKRQYVNSSETWYSGIEDNTAKWILRGAMIASASAVIGMSILFAVKIAKGAAYQASSVAIEASQMANALNMSIDSVGGAGMYSQAAQTAKFGEIGLGTKWRVSLGTGPLAVFGVVMFVFIVVVLVFLIMDLEVFNKPVYTQKPRIIFHNFADSKGKSIYARYDAVTDQNNQICDVRNKHSKQWVVLYTSKDKNVGNPILAESIKGIYSSSEVLSKEYSPVHRIGENTVFNIQDGNTCLFYYKRDNSAFPKTGSTFSAGEFTLALCGGILGGAILGWIATWFILKRKNKNTELLKNETPKAGA